jgi:hypothetical protein
MRRILAVGVLVAVLSTGVAVRAGAPLGRCRMQLTELQSEIRVHYVLRTPTPHRRWRFKVFDEGVVVFRKVYRTDDDGNIGVWTKIARRPGYRSYDGRATDLVSAARCSITLRT